MVPKISIIVPVYKAEAYLHRCVDSILSQTFRDFEVLLIDDGSPDKSGEICDEYVLKDKRIRVFHKENGGVSFARQCGIDNALGEYTIHVDPDDWIESTMLEGLYRKAKEEDADMVICDFFYEYRKTNQLIYVQQRPSALNHDVVLKELFQQLHGSCCNKLVRRVCYKKYDVKFPLGISFCEDLYVNASFLKNEIKISYLAKAFYHYVQDINVNSLVSVYNSNTVIKDKFTEQLFGDLLKNTAAYKACKDKFSFIIVHRGYIGKCFNSVEFKQHFYEFRKDLWNNPNTNFKNQIKLYFSCVGYYTFIYKLQSIISVILKRK